MLGASLPCHDWGMSDSFAAASASDQTPTSRASGFDARAARAAAAGLGAVGAGLVALNTTIGVGVTCPFRALTGWRCPLCGSTHLGAALVQGDVAGAWAANQATFVAAVMLAGCMALWVVEVLGGPAVRPPRSWPRLTQRRAYIGVLVLAAAWTLTRNLVPALRA